VCSFYAFWANTHEPPPPQIEATSFWNQEARMAADAGSGVAIVSSARSNCEERKLLLITEGERM